MKFLVGEIESSSDTDKIICIEARTYNMLSQLGSLGLCEDCREDAAAVLVENWKLRREEPVIPVT